MPKDIRHPRLNGDIHQSPDIPGLSNSPITPADLEHLLNDLCGSEDTLDDTARGRKVAESAIRGHAATHGAQEKKEAKWQAWQEIIDNLHAEFPKYSHHKLCEIASATFRIPAITLRKNTRIKSVDKSGHLSENTLLECGFPPNTPENPS